MYRSMGESESEPRQPGNARPTFEHFELSIPRYCRDCRRTQTLRKALLDRTPALVPVFGFSLVFPSFLLLTLGGSRDKPHWTKLPPVRSSDIMTLAEFYQILRHARLQKTQLSRQIPSCQSRGSNLLGDHETRLQQPFLHSSECLKKARREAHFQVKRCKTPGSRNTFGS